MWGRKKSTAVNVCFGFVLIAILGLADGNSEAAPASGATGPSRQVAFLTGPNTGNPQAIARRYVVQNKGKLGLSSIDIAGAEITDQYTTKHNGVTHIYLRQQYQGIEVHNANININIAADGSVINLGNRFVSGIDAAVNTTVPFLTRGEAISAAAYSMGLDPAKGPVSRNAIPTRLVYQPVAKGLVRLAWDLEIYELDANNWWSMRVDAINGSVLDQKNYVARDSYEVYAIPVESPHHGSRSVVSSPADPAASPSGWVDTQCTKGNNVDAYLDTNNSNSPTGGNGARACDGGLNFLFPIDLSQEPNQYQDASVTNLFYWNNIMHDVFYRYGFDEASGNFQEDNGANGGVGSDSVNAEAQDGGGIDNANFATPPDGSNPRMQMYLWDLTNPKRDGDLDNGIVIHEYGHGISIRLTGGPNNVLCLENTEQAGEGWSDYFAVVMTIEPGDMSTDPRGMGTYAVGQQPGWVGIRDFPYSTDMVLVDPRTYDWIKVASVPHGVGSTWTAMVWEMTWALIDAYGWDPDLHNGSGGNNIALQLVVDGLKLQPCSPGFVDSRDAILLADQLNNGGANQCLIWEAFARRGLGYSADQGSSFSRSDGVEAFDTPLVCQEVLAVTVSANPDPVQAGQVLTYSLQAQNTTTGTLTGVTVTDTVPALSSYVPGSATCGGSESAGTVTFLLGTMASGSNNTCEFQVTVSPSAATVVMADDMENGSGTWIASHGAGAVDWSMTTNNPHSPVMAWFADDIATSSDQYLAMANPIAINNNTVFSFWHKYDTEAAWDGGVVEISVNGGAWTDLGDMMVENGYNSLINFNPASTISGRWAFSGNSVNYIKTLVDLSSFAGNTAQVRFRMATDGLVDGDGWYVDDVEFVEDALISNTACVTAAEGDNDCDTVDTSITPAGGPPPPTAPEIAVSPASLSSTQDADQQNSQALNIGNTGDALLTWNVMTDSTGNCASPDNNLSWASASPLNGQTDPSANSVVNVTFDSAGLSPGSSQSGALCVLSDDTGNPEVTVALTLTVNSAPPPPPTAPEIAVSPASLSSTQDADQQTSQALNIGNTGDALLTWNVMTDSTGNCASPDNNLSWASASPVNGQTDPSANSVVNVTFDSAGLTPGSSQSGALCVLSNDTGNPEVTVPLTLNVNSAPPPPTAPEIAVSPASLSSTQDADQQNSQALTIDNTGDALLTWDVMTDSGSNCVSPDNNLPWASASPLNGQTDPSANSIVNVTFDSAGLAPGSSQSGALCVLSNDTGNPEVTVALTLNVNSAPPPPNDDQLATGEIPGEGAVTGTYVDTQVDDGVSQMITELHQGGKPANRIDAMEHTWVFQLTTGVGLTFNANAWVIEPVSEGDNIVLSYSSNNANYTPLYTVSSSSSDNDITVQIPDQVAGPLYIRAVDANRDPGNYSNASYYVDHMSITEGGISVPPSSIAMTISGLADESVLSSRRNRWDAIARATVVEDLTSNPVDGAVVSGSFSNGGGGSCTTNSSGECTITKSNIKLNVQPVTFTVQSVTRGPLDTYVAPPDPTVMLSPP